MITMKKSKYLAFCIFLFSFLVYYTFIPKEFNYNMDAPVSGDFLNIAKAYQVVPTDVSHYIPGRIISGKYVTYANWPPLFPLFLGHILNFDSNDFLLKARVIMVMISALTILCFFNLLKFVFKASVPAFFGSLIYLFLPFQIVYSSLIACDVFVPLFFILIAHLYLYYFSRNKLTDNLIKTIALSFLIVLGAFISWQVFFVLPAILLFNLIKLKKIKWPEIIIALIVIVFVSLWFYWILIKGTKSDNINNMFSQLIHRSLFGLFDPEMGISFLKRTGKFLLGLSPFLVFLIFTNRRSGSKNMETNNDLTNLIWIMGATLVFYFIVMPGMFGPHEFQFLLLFPFFLLLLISYLIKEGKSAIMKQRLIQYIIVCLFFLNFLIPPIHSYGKELGEFNEKLIAYVNDNSTVRKYKYLIIDQELLVAKKNTIYLSLFAVTSRTNLFYRPVSMQGDSFVDSLKQTDSLVANLRRSVSLFLKNRFDSTGFFMITKNKIPFKLPGYIIRMSSKEWGYIYYFNRISVERAVPINRNEHARI